MKVYILYLLLIQDGSIAIYPQTKFYYAGECETASQEIIESISPYVDYAWAECYSEDIPYAEYSYDGRVF